MAVTSGKDEMGGERVDVGGGEDVDVAEKRVWGPSNGGYKGGDR